MKYEVIARTDQLTNDEWLDLRATGIGGSDLASIYNESPWTSRYSLWAEKSGRVTRENKTNDAMEWGHFLEDAVAAKFAKEYDAVVVKWPVMLRSKKYPMMLANVDFFICHITDANQHGFQPGVVNLYTGADEPTGILSILEIKTNGIVGRSNFAAWQDTHVPRNYELQGLHYATVTGRDSVVFAALIAGEGLVVRGRVYGTEEMAECAERVSEFWSLVTTGTEPDTDGLDSTHDTLAKMYPKHREGVTVEADDFLLETFGAYVKAVEVEKQSTERVKELRARLEVAIGDAEAMTSDGTTLFTYKATKDSETFDAKAFREANPELAAAYMKPKSGYRVLRVKGEA